MAGQYSSRPDWCENNGFNEWGHFYISEQCPCYTYAEQWVCNGMCVTMPRNTREVRDTFPGAGCRLPQINECP